MEVQAISLLVLMMYTEYMLLRDKCVIQCNNIQYLVVTAQQCYNMLAYTNYSTMAYVT